MSRHSRANLYPARRRKLAASHTDAAGVVMHDSSGRLVVASEQAAVLLGFKGPDPLIGRPALFEEGCAIGEAGAPWSLEPQPAAIAFRTGTDVTPIRIGLLAAAGD